MALDYYDHKTFIECLRNGDEKAYTYLVDRFYHRLCAYADSLVHDKDQAEDIVQNVLVRVWEKRKTLDARFSLKSFLFRSVRNEFVDHHRKRQSVAVLEKDYVETLRKFEGRDEAFFEKLLARAQREIQELPPKCQKIFLLSKRDGFTNSEIAEQLNLSKKTIEYHITKAFSILRRRTNNNLEPIFFILFGSGKRS